MFFESAGAIAVGWVDEVFVSPEFTFSFMGFEWLQPLPGNGMYFYFVLMAFCSIAAALGYRYRIAIISLAVLWSGVYLMHKASYNNHHYLMFLLSWMMVFTPAAKRFSLDSLRDGVQTKCYAFYWYLYVLLFLIVFTYAALAKVYPDWLAAIPLKYWLSFKGNTLLVGKLLSTDIMPWLMAYGGILFDLLVIPGLLYHKTRKWAFIASIVFHITNSLTFQIGTSLI